MNKIYTAKNEVGSSFSCVNTVMVSQSNIQLAGDSTTELLNSRRTDQQISLKSVQKIQARVLPTNLFPPSVKEVSLEIEGHKDIKFSDPSISVQTAAIKPRQKQFLEKYLETLQGSRRPITSQFAVRQEYFDEKNIHKMKSVSRALCPSNLLMIPKSHASYTQRMQLFKSKLEHEKLQIQNWQTPDSRLEKNPKELVFSNPLTPQTILMTTAIENKRHQARFHMISNNVRPTTSFNLTWQKRNKRNIENTSSLFQPRRFSSGMDDQFSQSYILREMLNQNLKKHPVPLEIYLEPQTPMDTRGTVLKAIETQPNEESKMSYFPNQLADPEQLKQPDMFTSFDDGTLSNNSKTLKKGQSRNQDILNSTQRITTELQQINKLKLFTLLKTSNGPDLTPDKGEVISPQKYMPYFKKKAQYLKLLDKPMFIASACKSPNNFSSIPQRIINRRGCQALSEMYVGASIDDYIKARKVLQNVHVGKNEHLKCSRANFNGKFKTQACQLKKLEVKRQKSQDSQTELQEVKKEPLSSTIQAQENEIKSSRISVAIKENLSHAVSDDELNSATLLEQIEGASQFVKSPSPKAIEEIYLVKKMKAFDMPLVSSRSENKGFKTKKSSFLHAHSQSHHSKEPQSNSDANLQKIISQSKIQKSPQRISQIQLQGQNIECDSKTHGDVSYTAEVKNTEIVIKQLGKNCVFQDHPPTLLITKIESEQEEKTIRNVEYSTFIRPQEPETHSTQRDNNSQSNLFNSFFHLDSNINTVKNCVITSKMHHLTKPKRFGGKNVLRKNVRSKACEMISPTQIQVLEDIASFQFTYKPSDRCQSQSMPRSPIKYALFQKQRGKNINSKKQESQTRCCSLIPEDSLEQVNNPQAKSLNLRKRGF